MLPSASPALSMSSPNSRKRPAPGAGPVLPLQQYQQPFVAPPQPDQVPRWPGGIASDATSFTDPTRDVASFMMSAPNQSPAQGYPAIPSNAIARRPNRALVPTGGRQSALAVADSWPGFGDEAALIAQPAPGAPLHEHDNIQLLEEKAARAKREAQANRKQIPPFVQKLSSFLEEQKNTDLIRWSEKGDSFIVLDEDEFAKTLIPELFKHNNYASFVRQLNMYGFHKRVGLSDNSMKASERKNKSPSEYYNPYFKRGHPNLLWLINKPKGGGNKKKGKKEDGDGDSEEEAVGAEDSYPSLMAGPTQTTSRGGPAPGHLGHVSSDLSSLQRKDMQVVKDQLGQIQQQQKTISTLINRLRQEHNQLYQQAVVFQDMHERHENSINAILNFLANVFRKSLEEQGGVQSVSDLLASMMPNSGGGGAGAGGQIPQGSVFDLGDIFHSQQQATADRATTVSPPKRPQRLLPPIPTSSGASSNGRASTVASSPASAASPYPAGQMGTVTELFDNGPGDVTSPTSYLGHELRNNPQEGMMRLINDTNAGNSPSGGIDFPDVVSKTPVSMTTDQRNKMLSMMAATMPPTPSTIASVSPSVPSTTGFPPSSFPTSSPTVTASAGITPKPAPPKLSSTLGASSTIPAAAPVGGPTTSLSPIMSSMPPPPSLHDLSMTDQELEALQRLQEDQRSKIDELSQLLGPLSPSGRIPGIDEHGNPIAHSEGSYFPDNLDLEQFLNPNAFGPGFESTDFGGGSTAADGGASGATHAGDDFNFSLDSPFGASGGGGTGLLGDGLQLGGHAAEQQGDTPSSVATEEVFRHDLTGSPPRDAKRRRMG